jgi:hypothetical protein
MDAATRAIGDDAIQTMMPKDVMLFAMRLAAAQGWWFKAADVAKEAAQYFHPKLASTELKNLDDTSSKSEEELQIELDEIRRRTRVADRARALEEKLQIESSKLGGGGSERPEPEPGETSPTVDLAA